MWETSGRLLRLLSLLQTRREWSGAELAERLAVSGRTVRRDVDRLRALGYPVNATVGVPGYQLGPGATLPPLLLDDDEAVAVAVGLRTAAGGSVSGIEETSVNALAKLEQILPSRLRHRVNALGSITVPVAGGGPPVDPDVLTAIAAAARNLERLRFDYAGHDGTETVRDTEPHRLVHTPRRWYLVAWDVDRADWRTFRVDRIRPRIPTGPRFAPRELPEEGVAAFTSRGVSVRAYRYQGRFTIHAPAAAVTERIPPTVGVVEPLGDERCELRAGSNSLDELTLYVALLGFDFDVHEPAELRAHLGGLGARITRASSLPGADQVDGPGAQRGADG